MSFLIAEEIIYNRKTLRVLFAHFALFALKTGSI